MATGDVHLKAITRAIIPVWMVAGIFLVLIQNWTPCFVSLGLFFLVCRYVDPDMDSFSTLAAEWRIKRELNLLGVYMAGWWTIYAAQMDWILRKGSHRSWLTHSILPGTLTRVIWFDLPFVFPMAWLSNKYPWVIANIYPAIPQVLLGQFLAFAIGDMIHLYLDDMLPFFRYHKEENHNEFTNHRK
jgi:hypothetical protein